MSTIYLHIGLEKTGSTSIQHFLHTNTESLENQGYIVPKSLFIKPNHVELATLFCCKENRGQLRVPSNRNDFLSSLDSLLRENQETNIILTNEHLSSRLTKEEEIENLKKTLSKHKHDIEIIIYTRDYKKWITSSYLEAIKSGYYKKIDDYIVGDNERPWGPAFNTAPDILKRWHNVFNKKHIKVFSFEGATSKGIDVHFIENAISKKIDHSNFIKSTEVKNKSLKNWHIIILRILNKVLFENNRPHYFRALIISALQRLPKGKEFKTSFENEKHLNELLDKLNTKTSKYLNQCDL